MDNCSRPMASRRKGRLGVAGGGQEKVLCVHSALGEEGWTEARGGVSREKRARRSA